MLVRPGAREFLEEMGKHYEVAIFTAALQDYADWILDQLDVKCNIKHRLYRQHALPYGANYIKDLSRVGRTLKRVIIVDNLAENFQLQPENGIMIKSWIDDPNDTALFELIPILRGILCWQNCRDRNKEGGGCEGGVDDIWGADGEAERGGCTQVLFQFRQLTFPNTLIVIAQVISLDIKVNHLRGRHLQLLINSRQQVLIQQCF